MGLKVIGAGLPRTGTTSLKQSLELLLGGRCYHMFELMERVEADGLRWFQALDGDHDQLDTILDGWAAAVDWPSSILWRELSDRNPDALVVLSHRGDANTWWQSVDATVWEAMRRNEHGDDEIIKVFNQTMRRRAGLGADWSDETAAKTFYDQHFASVVEAIPAERLLIWQPSEGFGPLCERLGLPEPDVAAVHANTTAEFRSRGGWD